MDTIMVVLILLVVTSLIAIILSSNKAKNGNMIPLEFRHIEGFPNLLSGQIITISSNENNIIVNNYSISKKNVKYKTITNAKMLTDKQKSVIQRSLAGVLVAGPLGAIVGGISGVGTKSSIETVNFLTIGFKDKDDVDKTAIFALEQTSHSMYLNLFAQSK